MFTELDKIFIRAMMEQLVGAIKYAADTYYETEKNKRANTVAHLWDRDSSGGPQ